MNDTKKSDVLLPAYLITGEDELKRETVLARLRKRVEAMGDISFNYESFEGDTAQGDAIVSACNTVPFASEVRLVLVTAAEKLKKKDAEVVVEYLNSPSPTTVLALVSPGLAKNTRLYKAVAGLGKTAVIDCSAQKKNDLPKMVRSLAVGHGVTFTDAAAVKLVELVGDNTIRLNSEIEKIALARNDEAAVNERVVEALVAKTAGPKPWELVDAFSSRNAKRCVELYSYIESDSPFRLLNMCVTRIRELMCAQSLISRGAAQTLPSVLGVPSWRTKNHLAWARGYTGDELRNALIAARDAERAMKRGADARTTFLDWLLKVIAK